MIDITERDHDILETLTRRVHLLSIDYVRCIWWPNQATNRNTRRRLRQLARRGFIERRIVNLHVPLDILEPLAIWRPGMPMPDPIAISKASNNRQRGATEPIELFTATRLTANLFGSAACGLPKLFELDHDLLLAEVYVLYRLSRPTLARQWLGEGALPKDVIEIKVPDAILFDDVGKPYRVIESTGRRTPRQIEAFHQHCFEYDLPYELW